MSPYPFITSSYTTAHISALRFSFESGLRLKRTYTEQRTTREEILTARMMAFSVSLTPMRSSSLGAGSTVWTSDIGDLDCLLYYVSPQPNQIVVLLVEGDPGEGHLGFFYLTPVSQERRLPVACRGAYEGGLVVQGFPQDSEQPATYQLLGARQGRLRLGLEYDPGRVNA
jgi:hypothetical protein